MSFLSNLFNTGTPKLFTVIDEKDRKLAQAVELLRIQDVVIDDLIEELTILTEKVEFLAGEVKALADECEESEELNEVMADELLQTAKSIIDSVVEAGYKVTFQFSED